MTQKVTLNKAKVKKIIFYNAQSNWGVLSLIIDEVIEGLNDNTPEFLGGDKEVTAAGNFEGLYEDCLVTVTGSIVEHAKYGKQLAIESYKLVEDTSSKEAIVNFLTKSTISGIHKQLALKIYEKFGKDSIHVVLHETEKLIGVSGIGNKTYEVVKQSVAEYMQMEELLNYCSQIGLTKYSLITQLYKEFGTSAVKIIKDNPYKLTELSESFTFAQADEIAMKSGVAVDDDNRLLYGLRYSLYRESVLRGSTGCEDSILKQAFFKTLNINDNHLYRYSVTKLDDAGLIQRDDNNVYLTMFYDAERAVSDRLKEMIGNPVTKIYNEDVIQREIMSFPFVLNDDQVEAIYNCLKFRCNVITSLSGCGKSTITKAILNILEHHHENLILLAPTAKAAKRLNECTGREAMTIHRYLKVFDNTLESSETVVTPNKSTVVVDEASMLDVRLFEKLLETFQKDTRLILVGDVHQLPSVQAGNILNDVIESNKANTCYLRTITRQAENSNIIYYGNRINEGQLIPTSIKEADFTVLDVPEQYRNKLVTTLIQSYLKNVDKYGLNEVQVICAYKQGVLGVNNINKVLKESYQTYINPSIDLSKKELFQFNVGDKVRHTVNNYNLNVFNGETGVIYAIKSAENSEEGKDTLVVNYGDKFVTYDRTTISQLQLAYASTVHASQGSEYAVVYVLVDHEISTSLLIRKLAYTAVTRAKLKCYILSVDNSINIAINNNYFRPRLTKLSEFISRRSEEELNEYCFD